MKIGIVTFHNAPNTGAVLQAYALQSVLQSRGHEVEFINYRRPYQFSIRNFIAKSPKLAFTKCKNEIRQFLFQYDTSFVKALHVSAKTYTSYQALKNDKLDYDMVIAGSDQIWNFHNSLEAYWLLDFVPQHIKKISYAASMGQCRLNPELADDFKKSLSSFSAISLREKNGVDFVQRLFGSERKIYQTVDPTLLLTRENYHRIIEEPTEKSRLCTYILSSMEKGHYTILEEVEKYMGCKAFNMRNPSTCVHLSERQNKILTPYQWLGYIKNADFVVCSSFHTVVFSLIFHKPFILLVPDSAKAKGGNVRVNSLLEPLGLLHHCLYDNEEGKVYELMQERIDWDNVDYKLQEMKNSSLAFLFEAIGSR